MKFYNDFLNVSSSDIIWMDANKNLVSDKDDEMVMFNIANNGQSSSILEFGTHSSEHPDVKFIDK